MEPNPLKHNLSGWQGPVAILTVVVVLLTACYPPAGGGPVPQAVTPSSEQSTPSPTEYDWKATTAAGAALTMQTSLGEQLLLQPADIVIASLSFSGFRDELSDGKVPGITATTPGCALLALMTSAVDDQSRDLAYNDLIADQIISPKTWSDYGVYTTTIASDVAYVTGPPIAIANATAFSSGGSCTDALDASLDQLLQETSGMAETAQRIVISAQVDGELRTYLVIFEPAIPDGCIWVLSQCSGCKKCGYEVICSFAEYLCQ